MAVIIIKSEYAKLTLIYYCPQTTAVFVGPVIRI